jgi:ribosomal RNA-processing protein 8
MFAVPGWAVSADTLSQQGAVKSAKAEVQKPQEQAFADSRAKSKKRKRPDREQSASSKVSAEDLERLWNKQFGRRPERVRSKKVKGRAGGEDVESAPVGNEQSKHDQPEHAQSKHVQPKTVEPAHPRKHQKAAPEVNGAGLGLNENTRHNAGTLHAPHDSSEAAKLRKEKKRDKKRKRDDGISKPANSNTTSTLTATIPPPPPLPPAPSTLTPLQAKMRSKLTSARFRHLNQTLYTTTSSSALELFTASPDLFAEYHAGFSQQVRDSWPSNPVALYISAIKTRGIIPSDDANSLPRRKTGSCTIADLGCGDAPLARGCQSQIKNLQLKFHNYDLHAPNSHVTVADISDLPLRDGEADIAVFCLSLMGTNWLSFVEEAWRILRGDGKGECWVAEVKSRFGRVSKKGRVVENSVGKKRKVQQQQQQKGDDEDVLAEVDGDGAEPSAADETDISAFVAVFQRRGFELKSESVQKGNKMFVSMVFVKSGVPSAGTHKGKKWNGKEYRIVHDGKMRFAKDNDDEVTPEEESRVLKPCVYKTR